MSITAHPLCWPTQFPRRQNRESGRFQTTLAGALENVQSSLRLFAKDSDKKIDGVVISSNVTLGQQRPADPGVAVWFSWDGLQVCIPVDRYDKVEGNLQAIHHIIEARRTELEARWARDRARDLHRVQGAASAAGVQDVAADPRLRREHSGHAGSRAGAVSRSRVEGAPRQGRQRRRHGGGQPRLGRGAAGAEAMKPGRELLAKALEIADESVLCTLSSTCGFPDANGWRECHYHREEHEKKALAYAAARGLIERHPKNKALYKVTTAGQLVRDEEGPTHMSKERAAEILANYKPTVFESRNGKRVEVPFKTPVER
jgi:hypothetical protein